MFIESISGFAAGVTGTLIGYPLDSVKTRMQAGRGEAGMFHLIKSIAREEGPLGFYRGVASPLVALTILNTLNFSSYACFRQIYDVKDELIKESSVIPPKFEWRVFLAGASVGPIASMISTPFELVKTQMVMRSRNRTTSSPQERHSSIQQARTLVREYGVRSLYVAHGVNTCREVLFLGTYFTIYEHSKTKMAAILDPFNIGTKWSIPVSGGLAGAVGWAVSFPLDCIKSNIQSLPFTSGGQVGLRPGAIQVARTLLITKGVKGLYSGVLPSITRAFLVSATRFSVYESVSNALRIPAGSVN
jgi:solute carrier family 25 carnitine/acylcarnitine transporter 20/29